MVKKIIEVVHLILMVLSLAAFLTFTTIYIVDKHKESKDRQYLSKNEVFQIEANPYDVNVNIIITQDTAKALAYVKAHTDSSFTIKDFRGVEAVTFMGYGNPTIWFPSLTKSTEDISKATHELMHVLYFVTSRAGIVLNDETHEAFAYELDYLTLQLFKNIK